MTDFINNPARGLALIAGMAALTACAPDSGPGQFYREAGVQIDQGEFGNATLHNQLVQTCRKNGAGLGKAGGQAADPLVVLDPKSTPSRPVYRVHCSGQLDGKYARVLYRGYIGSAAQKSQVEEADAE
ncbi:MAG: hypothetical protein AAF999_08910 [Pseudomonadota bacterium]